MRHKSNNKTRPLFTLSLEMTRLVNETRLLLVPCFNSDIYGTCIHALRQLLVRSEANILPQIVPEIWGDKLNLNGIWSQERATIAYNVRKYAAVEPKNLKPDAQK